MKRNLVLLLAVLVAAEFAVETTFAAVPMLISHQGRLLDAANQPVTGTRNLTFRIFETPTGGIPLWTETHMAIPVANGLFNVILGSSISISGDLLVTGGTLPTERYLSIQVEGDADELSPRRRLTSSAYAVAASRVSGDVQTLPGELSLVDFNGNGSTTATIRALQPLVGDLTIHSTSFSGSTTGTIRMQATPDSAVSSVGLDSDGDAVLDVGTSITAGASNGVLKNLPLVNRNVLKSFFQTGDKPTQAQFVTQYGESDMELTVTEFDELHTATVSADSIGSELELKQMHLGGLSGSTTATIRAASPSGGQVHLSGMSGSTTGTIRMMASADSADHEESFDDALFGVSSKVKEKANKTKCSTNLAYLRTFAPASSTELDESCDSTSASSRWKGMSGSTTGTIRMAATADSVGNYLDYDDDGDGIAEHTIWQKVDNSSTSIEASSRFGTGPRQTTSQDGSFAHAAMRCQTDLDVDGVADNSVEQVSNASKAYMAIKTKGTGAQRTTILAEASDSGIFDISVDDDGDGTARAKGIVTCKPASGGAGGTKGKFSYDVDDDGDFDNEVDITSNGVGAGTRLIGRGGSTTGTIRMTATPDSSVFDLGISGSTTGTIRIQTSSTGTASPIEHSSGAHLTVGGDWTNASDKNLKENFSEVNGEELLEKIDDLPISQWNYKNEGESITHIGPTSQDFKDTFGVGGNDKTISTIDPSGIALAAIKELNKQNQELAKQNAELMKELKELKKKVDDLASRR